MRSIDTRTLSKFNRVETEICIIGAGAAGVTLAREFVGTRHDVCLIESGGLAPDEDTQSLYELSSIGYPVRQNFMSRARYFGGTSNLWAGRSMRLDPIDLAQREWVPDSGWPIDYAELEAWYPRAEQVLGLPDRTQVDAGLGRLRAGQGPERGLFRGADLKPHLALWARSPMRFRKAFRKALERSPNVRIYLNANVTEIEPDESGRHVRLVHAETLTGQQLLISAKRYVLACGGLENARLLLLSRRRHPNGIGNEHDVVGRYFMEHPRAIVGTVHLSVPLSSSLVLGAPLPDGKVQVGIALTDEAQRRERLLNSYLALEPQLSAIGRQAYQSSANVVKVLTRTGYAGKRSDVFRVRLPEVRDLAYLLTPKEVMPHFIYRQYARLKALSHLFRKVSTLTIINFCEQMPRRDSRVYLATTRDRLGLNTLVLDWKIGDEETRSLRRLQHMLAVRVAREGLGEVKMMPADAAPEYTDASHHIGTTRMSNDPRAGVVDRNARVHGMENLYIAGSSVFPTAGNANPTLTLVALALRLADHFKRDTRPSPAGAP
jgi:choline dehydrogenase-like flavoprotein